MFYDFLTFSDKFIKIVIDLLIFKELPLDVWSQVPLNSDDSYVLFRYKTQTTVNNLYCPDFKKGRH